MPFYNEASMTPSQIHFLRALLDGKREISEQEAEIRIAQLELRELTLPCAAVCVSPYYVSVPFDRKDDAIRASSEYVSRFFQRAGYRCYCLTNTYDNMQVLLPMTGHSPGGQDLDELCIALREKFYNHFGLDLFIGIGSVAEKYTEISRSAIEAGEMLAFKHQYADRGVINIINTFRFKHYSIYSEDVMFSRVLGRFQGGDLAMMAVRLQELVESVRHRPGVSRTAIKRTFIELAVNILRIASNADVDVDAVLEPTDFYSWILKQNHTEVMTDWLLDLSGKLMVLMEHHQEAEEKEVIKQACDHIEEQIGETSLSLQTVSGVVGLSPAYFSQLFKKEKGINLSSYITERRIERAKDLLRATERKAEDIARQTGFASATYFGRVFKKSTGMTPNGYRRQSRHAPAGEN